MTLLDEARNAGNVASVNLDAFTNLDSVHYDNLLINHLVIARPMPLPPHVTFPHLNSRFFGAISRTENRDILCYSIGNRGHGDVRKRTKVCNGD